MFDLHAQALGLKPIFWDTLAPAPHTTHCSARATMG